MPPPWYFSGHNLSISHMTNNNELISWFFFKIELIFIRIKESRTKRKQKGSVLRITYTRNFLKGNQNNWSWLELCCYADERNEWARRLRRPPTPPVLSTTDAAASGSPTAGHHHHHEQPIGRNDPEIPPNKTATTTENYFISLHLFFFFKMSQKLVCRCKMQRYM